MPLGLRTATFHWERPEMEGRSGSSFAAPRFGARKMSLCGATAIALLFLSGNGTVATSWFRKGLPHQLAIDKILLSARRTTNRQPLTEVILDRVRWNGPAEGELEDHQEAQSRHTRETPDRYYIGSLSCSVQEEFFMQPLDHFNPILFSDDKNSWWQRYYSVSRGKAVAPTSSHVPQETYNHVPARRVDDVSSAARRPIFIYIGGEGPLTEDALKIGMVPEMAHEFNAELFGLEHRYYGKSHPTPNSAVENLQWLTSEQALADLGRFVAHVKERRSKAFPVASSEIPVVVFGCSYPGALAAYFRSKYPAAILGAVASSSPVEALEDFTQYDTTVKSQLPHECVDVVQTATSLVEAYIFSAEKSQPNLISGKDKGHVLDTEKKLTELFGCENSPMSTNDDKVGFLYVLADAVASAVQYNRPPQRPLITMVCTEIGKARDGLPLEREELERIKQIDPDISLEHAKLLSSFSRAVKMMMQEFDETCEEANMRQLTDINLGESHSASARLWAWQSCSEYGFWQTGYPGSVRSQRIDMGWHLRACNEIFPMSKGKFISNVAAHSNLWSGGRNLATLGASTDIQFTNGGGDPWANLSVTSIGDELKKRQSLGSFVIPGASHCRDFGATIPSDESDLLRARREISEAIRQWLGEFSDQSSKRYVAEL